MHSVYSQAATIFKNREVGYASSKLNKYNFGKRLTSPRQTLIIWVSDILPTYAMFSMLFFCIFERSAHLYILQF